MLMRFDPFPDLERMLASPFRSPSMAIDAYRHDDVFVVKADLPGVDPDAIDVTLERDVVTITAERTWQPDEQDQVLVAERPQGTFSRRLFLGEGLDVEHMEAHYDHGVLTLSIPLAEAAKPRKVEIVSGSKPALETSGAAA
ncbi:MAG TPA: Hsp20/alpha crystallin family protein [Acidimicrobiia bacterium]|nr:Hsp20/alpha crystallin family protein [Acidimicrobiia bacterium]